MKQGLRSVSLATLAAVLLAGSLSACAPLLVGGAAVGTVLMASDRRTSGAQIAIGKPALATQRTAVPFLGGSARVYGLVGHFIGEHVGDHRIGHAPGTQLTAEQLPSAWPAA